MIQQRKAHPGTHRCPTWCHICPLMHGVIMPGCMGEAAMPTKDMSNCTCPPRDGGMLIMTAPVERRVREIIQEEIQRAKGSQ